MSKVLVHLPLVDVVTKKPEINRSDELSKISGKCWINSVQVSRKYKILTEYNTIRDGLSSGKLFKGNPYSCTTLHHINLFTRIIV